MEDGSTGPSGGSQPGQIHAPLNNRRQAFGILFTMAVFFVGLVILICWAAKNG
jgi:hypothetical protein